MLLSSSLRTARTVRFFIRMSFARRFALLELAFLAGVAGTSLRQPLLASVGSVIVLAVFARPRSMMLLLLAACMTLFGVMRFYASDPSPRLDSLPMLAGRKVTLTGEVAQEPDRRLEDQRLVVRVEKLLIPDGPRAVHGKTLVVTDPYPQYRYGEQLTIECRIERPRPIDGFAYDAYLAVSRIFSLCRLPHIRSTGLIRGSPVFRTLVALKAILLARIHERLPEPHASFLAGILLGARQGMSPAVEEDFRRAGLSHLVALSGYNISVLAAAVLATSLRLRVSRRHAFWVVTLSLAGFVLLTGASPSIVRAAVMGFLVVLARHVGRARHIWYALLFAATVMTLANPRVLLFDAGFQLSFLATLGLMLWSPWYAEHFRFVPERLGLREALASTLSATTATLPLLVTQFGRLSIVSPVVNMLVLPVMPLVMLAGTLSLFPLLGPLAAIPTWLGLTWILGWAHWFARLPFSTFTVHLPPWSALACYGGLALVFLIRLRHQRTQSRS